MRQLVWMTEGRDRFAWSLTASMMALIANCHTGKGKALTANDFNPTLSKEERLSDAILITEENVDIMRDEFRRSIEGKVTFIPIEEEEHGRTIGD